MQLQVKSNNRVVHMKKEIYDSLPHDQKMSYRVISTEDREVARNTKDQPVINEVKQPETGDKKDIKEKEKKK